MKKSEHVENPKKLHRWFLVSKLFLAIMQPLTVQS